MEEQEFSVDKLPKFGIMETVSRKEIGEVVKLAEEIICKISKKDTKEKAICEVGLQ